ncbi:MAG: AAC(3) family N-acetyltransferase [Verrucomicrobiales bacterium]|nr:AAC(3) family N-acetyltransferase [Verrucomicrobiales bacterium]
MNFIYSSDDVEIALKELGPGKGDSVYVTGNFGALGIHESRSKEGCLSGMLTSLVNTVAESGTIIVPTHSFSLCNSTEVFDCLSTPSERGPFTEYVRGHASSVRQFHPFASLSAFGSRAFQICSDTTRHAYGPNTPFDRLLDLDAWGVSVGMEARLTCSIVHHFEQLMAVPYRYTKEFIHPVCRDGETRGEPFYLFVCYQGCEIARDRNRKLFEALEMRGGLKSVSLGAGEVHAYRLRALWDVAKEMMSKDIYNWLESPPQTRPYRD